jgi:hypothetical protein
METMSVYWLTSVHAARIMTKQDLSLAAKKSKIAVVGLNPGFMRTERVLMHMNSKARKKTGQLLLVCDLAKEYGFTDVDGRYIPRFDPKAPMQAFPC